MEKTCIFLREKAISRPTFSYQLLKKLVFLTTLLAVFFLTACEKEIEQIHRPPADLSEGQVSAEVLEKSKALGFGTKGIIAIPEGYLVEGDIILSQEDLVETKNPNNARINQYRTTYLVKNLPRTITVSMASGLPASYGPALAEAIKRYNDLGIQLSFSQVAFGANISIVSGSGSYLASAGFPTASGNPYSRIMVNTTKIGTAPNVQYLATILAHEIGHCIGFRHTDYMDRSYSCGGTYDNEGSSTVGAKHITGTPTTAEPGSWMLSCIGAGVNRPFNPADQLSLRTLYGLPMDVLAKNVVTALYKQLLQREPDQPGLEKWSTDLQNGQTVKDLVRGIVFSEEYKQKSIYSYIVYDLYSNILGRTDEQIRSDMNGYLHHIHLLSKKQISIRGMVRAFVSSQEYKQAFIDPLTREDAVRQLYFRLLCRKTVSNEDIAHWVQQSYATGWQSVVDGFIYSAEYTQKWGENTVPSWNESSLNKSVKSFYKTILARDASNQDIENWAQEFKMRGEDLILTGFVESLEYQTRFGDNCVPGNPIIACFL